MGPGPSELYPDVIEALSLPVIGHLDPVFIELMDQVQALQRRAFQTETPWAFTISAPASAAMEAALANLLEPGDRMVACINGVFGGRMAEMGRRLGAEVIELHAPWGQPVDPQALRDLLARQGTVRLAAFVHAETSTGVRSDAAALAAVCRDFGCLSLVDSVTALGGVELDMDGWGLDVVFAGSQKCLSCVPGIAPLMVGPRAWERIESRQTPCVSWFLDLKLLAGYWGGSARRSYHHTAPVNAIYAWHAALRRLLDEGLEAAWQRHATISNLLQDGLATLGLKTAIDRRWCLPQLTVVEIPHGVDDAAVRGQLLQQHDLEIGGGLGDWSGRMWRLGLMGQSCREENVDRVLAALATAMNRSEARVG